MLLSDILIYKSSFYPASLRRSNHRRLMISERRRSNKRAKTKSIQKAAERDRGRTPKRLSGRLRYRSALDFSFSFVCGAGVCLSRRACGAPQNERSEFWGLAGEPTCIRQAHVTVPKGNLPLKKYFYNHLTLTQRQVV